MTLVLLCFNGGQQKHIDLLYAQDTVGNVNLIITIKNLFRLACTVLLFIKIFQQLSLNDNAKPANAYCADKLNLEMEAVNLIRIILIRALNTSQPLKAFLFPKQKLCDREVVFKSF